MKRQNFSYRLFSSYTKKNGQASLQMLITIGSETKPFPLQEAWPANLYDHTTGTIKPRHKNDDDFEALCNRIEKFKGELYKIKEKIRSNEGYKVTFASLKRELKLENSRGHFPDLMLAMIDERVISPDKDIRIIEPTANGHRSSARKLAAYFKRKVPITAINYTFLCTYAQYLVEEDEMSHNSMRNQIKNIKTYLNFAIRKGIGVDISFQRVKIKEIKVPIKYLEQHELNLMMNLYAEGHLTGGKKQVLAAFIFTCLTGLRISDLYRANHNWIVSRSYMQFMPYKNHIRNPKILKVPLQDIAKKYIQNPKGRFFTLPTEQQYNSMLKELCGMAGVDIKPGSHSGRHTFGHLYIKWGGLLEALAEILGHEDLETTRTYVHITHDQKKEGAQKMESALLDMAKMRVAT